MLWSGTYVPESLLKRNERDVYFDAHVSYCVYSGVRRSHAVFTIHIEARSRIESSEKVAVSKLNIVDLTGSERVKKTQSDGLILREAGYINKSLSFLEQVVIALGSRTRYAV